MPAHVERFARQAALPWNSLLGSGQTLQRVMAETKSVCPLFLWVHLHPPPSIKTVYFQYTKSTFAH